MDNLLFLKEQYTSLPYIDYPEKKKNLRKIDAYNDFKKKFESYLPTDGFNEFIDANVPKLKEFKKLLTRYTEIIRRMHVIEGILFTIKGKEHLDITSLDDFIKLVDDGKSSQPAYNVKADIKQKIEAYIEKFKKNIEYARFKAQSPLSLKGITGSLRHI